MKQRRDQLRQWLVLILLGALALPGCGAGAPKSAEPPAPGPGGGADEADTAQSELDRGEWRITELFGPPAGVRQDAAPTEAPAASAAPTATYAAPPTPQSTQMSPGGESKPADACTIACTALASMERAARHLCEMSGPDEPRCTSARERVRNANDRVAAHCTCGI